MGPLPTCGHVVVLDDEITAWRDRVPQPGEHLDPPRKMEEQQPGVDQVERALRDGPILDQVVRDEGALMMPVALEPIEGEPAQRLVHVDADDASVGSHPLGQLAHRLARDRTLRRGSVLRAPG